MKNKRYMFVSRFLRGGGAERFVSVFASYLADCGYDIHLVLYERTKEDYPISEQVTIHMMPERPDNILGKICRTGDLANIIKSVKPDYVIPFLHMVLVTSFLACFINKSKYIYTVRMSPWDMGMSNGECFIHRIIVRFSSAIMLQTEEQGWFYPSDFKKKMFVVHNPVADIFIDNQKGVYSKDIRKITCIGRLTRQKGFDIAIETISRVVSDWPDIKLNIYGEGQLEGDLKGLIKQKGLENSCSICGRTSDIIGVLKETDLFVLSSNCEGMPNALLEAMALGVPCISSNCRTGPKDMIDDRVNGILFETGNADLLEDAIRWAIDNPFEMNEMGKEGRKFVIENFSMQQASISFLEMCEKIG